MDKNKYNSDMKKQINDLLLKMQTGENCIGETANELLNLFSVRRSYSFEDMERAYEEGIHEGTLRQMYKEKNKDNFIQSDLKYYMEVWD